MRAFFATLECELIDREQFQDPVEAGLPIFDYIEGFYNPRRRHSALDHASPVTFERQHAATA